MRVSVLVNARAGSVASRDRCLAQLADAFAAAAVDARIEACEPARLRAAARHAAALGYDAVVAAGGDGTVSAVAAGLIGTDVPLAVIPLGTLNHFARDLGIPTEVGEAARAIACGRVARIDVGEVNDRVFVNNASIGLYPELVVHREHERRQRRIRSKWIAMAFALVRVLRRFPLLRVRVALPDQELVCATPLVFVGNNVYATSMLELGARAELTAGCLGVYLVRCRGRWQMARLLARAVLGRLTAREDVVQACVEELWVGVRETRLRVALDGELAVLRTPLRFRIRPGALQVRGAHGQPVASPEAA